MALTRKLLKALNVSEEAIEEIITAHTDTVTELKNQLETAQDAQRQLETVTKERDEYKRKSEDTTAAQRITDLEQQIAAYKSRETEAQKKTALTALLESAGIDKRGFARVLAATDLSGIELGESGEIKDSDKLTERLKTEWADLLVGESSQTAPPATPPNNGAARMTKEQIMEIKDRGERQKMIAQNLDLFQQTKGE